MKIVVLTVFLSIMQVVPQQTSNHATNSNQNLQNETTAKQRKAVVPVSIPKNNNSPQYQNKIEQPSIDKAPNTVVRSEASPVPKKDNWDKAGTVLTGLLVFIGAFGVVCAVKTLWAIDRQATTMSEQVTQMVQQTGILQRSVGTTVSKERARISVLSPNDPQLYATDMFQKVIFHIHVFAPTPAIFVESKIAVEIADSEVPDKEKSFTFPFVPTELWSSGVLEKTASAFFLNAGGELNSALNDESKFLHFHGYIRYRDIFQDVTEKPHESVFSYTWRVGAPSASFKALALGRRWVSEWVENPPGSNYET